LKADFLKAFQSVAIAQTVLNPQVTVRGDWAFEISEVKTTLTPLHGSEPTHAPTTTVVPFRRLAAGDWKVARVIGLLSSPSPIQRNTSRGNVKHE
jgi:ketosteroid isomerase-like protein